MFSCEIPVRDYQFIRTVQIYIYIYIYYVLCRLFCIGGSSVGRGRGVPRESDPPRMAQTPLEKMENWKNRLKNTHKTDPYALRLEPLTFVKTDTHGQHLLECGKVLYFYNFVDKSGPPPPPPHTHTHKSPHRLLVKEALVFGVVSTHHCGFLTSITIKLPTILCNATGNFWLETGWVCCI